MKATIQIGVEAPASQINALVEQVADCARDAGATVTSSGYSKIEQTYTVIGAIKGKPTESYRAVIEAEDADDAQAKAIAEDDKRTIVGVFEGEVAPVAP